MMYIDEEITVELSGKPTRRNKMEKLYLRKPTHEGIKGSLAEDKVMTENEVLDYIREPHREFEGEISEYYGDVAFYEIDEETAVKNYNW